MSGTGPSFETKIQKPTYASDYSGSIRTPLCRFLHEFGGKTNPEGPSHVLAGVKSAKPPSPAATGAGTQALARKNGVLL
jgi:hypothetical protein